MWGEIIYQFPKLQRQHCWSLGMDKYFTPHFMIAVIIKSLLWFKLTHWGRMTHICVGKLTIIGSDNGLSPGRRQAIIWTNAGILLIWSLGTNFNEILIGIQTVSFKKMHLKMSSAKWRPFCLGLNVLNHVSKRDPWCSFQARFGVRIESSSNRSEMHIEATGKFQGNLTTPKQYLMISIFHEIS